MSAEMGPAPWNREFYEGYKPIRNKQARKAAHEAGLEYSLSAGWHRARQYEPGTKVKHPQMKQLTLISGRKVWVPDDDFNQYYKEKYGQSFNPEEGIGHNRTQEISDDMAAFIDHAFEKTSTGKYKRKIWSVPGKGHIHLMEYSTVNQLMQVTFTNNGAQVVYFRVPPGLFGSLARYAESDQVRIDKDGTPRHLLGIEFWNLIRVRGHQHGSRYKFAYVQDGSSLQITQNRRGRPNKIMDDGNRGETEEYIDSKTGKLVHKTISHEEAERKKANKAKQTAYEGELSDSEEAQLSREEWTPMNEKEKIEFEKLADRQANLRLTGSYLNAYNRLNYEDKIEYLIKHHIL